MCEFKNIVSDIETDGLNPTVIHLIGILDYDTNEYHSFYGDKIKDGLLILANADNIIGHNFIKYDAKVIKKLTYGLIDLDHEKILDTLVMSRIYFPDFPDHKLSTWGEYLDFPKLEFEDFTQLSDEMIEYCERDVRLNRLMFDIIKEKMEEEHGNNL